MDGELKNVLDTLTSVLRDVFDSDDLVATPKLTARIVKGRDSLGNVRLFLEIERNFSIRFSTVEIAALRNVGQLAERILQESRVVRLSAPVRIEAKLSMRTVSSLELRVRCF